MQTSLTGGPDYAFARIDPDDRTTNTSYSFGERSITTPRSRKDLPGCGSGNSGTDPPSTATKDTFSWYRLAFQV